jgi:hypothetical protein
MDAVGSSSEVISYFNFNQPHLIFPIELTLKIFSFLNVQELTGTRVICRAVKLVSEDSLLWRMLLKRDFPSKRQFEDVGPEIMYKKLYVSKRNWETGCFQSREIITNSKQEFPFFLTSGSHVIIRYTDQSLHIWDLQRDTDSELEDPSNPDDNLVDDKDLFISHISLGARFILDIWYKDLNKRSFSSNKFFAKDQDVIVIPVFRPTSSSFELQVRNQLDGSICFSLNGKPPCVLSEGNVYSKHQEKKVKKWDKFDGSFVAEYIYPDEKDIEHATVTAIRVGGVHIFGSYSNGIIGVWDKTTTTFIRKLVPTFGESPNVEHLRIDGNILISRYSGNVIAAWGITDGTLLYTHEGQSKFIVDEERMITATTDGTIEIWNKYDGSFLFKILTHHFKIECLIIKDQVLISSDHQSIALWNKFTGDLISEFIDCSRPTIVGDCLFCSTKEGNIHIYNFAEKAFRTTSTKTEFA